MARQAEQHLNSARLAELSALADGSLDPSRRAAVEEAIESSPELQALYERERSAVHALRHAAAERAPERLHARIAAQRTRRSERRPNRRRARYAAVAGSAAAAAALTLALVLPGGTPGAPSVTQAALLAARGPTAPAPPADARDPRNELAQRLQGVYFPNWSSRLGWHASGVRSDILAGHRAITVYYRRGGARVAYTIIAVPALAQPSSPVAYVNGLALRALRVAGHTVVTWRRAGHTCVLTAEGVPVGVLEQLASWRGSTISE